MTTRPNWNLLAGLRFIFAALVATAHLSMFVPCPQPVAAGRAILAMAAVLGFLVISGYSIAASLQRETTHFYGRRFWRIYPAYAAALLVSWLPALDYRHLSAHHLLRVGHPSAAGFLGNATFLQGFFVAPLVTNPVFWTLSAEVLFYALAPLLLRCKPLSLVTLIAASAAAFALHPHLRHPNLWDDGYAIPALCLLWAWLLGFIGFQRRHDWKAAALLVGVGVVSLGAYGLSLYSAKATAVGVVAFVLFTAIFLCSDRLQLGARMGRIWSYGGDLSYPLYLVHYPVILAVLSLRPGSGWKTLLPAIALATLAVHHLVELPVRASQKKRQLARRDGPVAQVKPGMRVTAFPTVTGSHTRETA